MEKAKGKENPVSSNVPEEVEASPVDDVNAEQNPSEPLKVEETAMDADFDEPEDDEEQEEEQVEEDGTVEAAADTVLIEDEKVEGGGKNEEVKGDEKGAASSKKARVARRRRKNKAVVIASPSNDVNKSERPASEKKLKKKVDGMGLIFMCNAKTKMDCFKLKVLGLPKSKKDMVSQVYKGMRLFLYDIDLKLMYGIYKAASPGGYNLEPKAFKSAFPSQVRFTVHNECNPLPPEKFKAAIKENYYGKNKFNCQLSPEQVKNLCKLFLSEGKGPNHVGRAVKEPASAPRERKTGRRGGGHRRFPDVVRHERLRAPQPYTREAYSPPPLHVMAPAPPTYNYVRPVDDYYYRRELPPPLDYNRGDVDIMRPREYNEPYSRYAETAPYYPPSAQLVYASPPASVYAPPSHQPMYRY